MASGQMRNPIAASSKVQHQAWPALPALSPAFLFLILPSQPCQAPPTAGSLHKPPWGSVLGVGGFAQPLVRLPPKGGSCPCPRAAFRPPVERSPPFRLRPFLSFRAQDRLHLLFCLSSCLSPILSVNPTETELCCSAPEPSTEPGTEPRSSASGRQSLPDGGVSSTQGLPLRFWILCSDNVSAR